MNIKKLLILTIIVLISACSSEDKVISIAADDPEMLEAISKARQSLPTFWQVFDNQQNGESDFSLKIKISDKDQVEFFWVINIKRENGKVTGEIGNDPELVTNVKIGEIIEIHDDAIADWLYMRNKKIVGNFTIRPLLKHMSESEAAEYKSMLYEP